MARKTILVPLLFLISLVALLSMHHLSLRNGMLAHRSGFNKPGAYLPNTSIPIQVRKTGVRVLDEYVALMVSIFWVDLDPRNVVAHIQGTHFLGTLTGTWIIMLVEAHRVDVTSSFLFSTVVIETIGELIGLGFMTPLWCILHTFVVSTGQPRRIAAKDHFALPIAFALGHILPTVIMVLADPAGSGLLSQQHWILVRLFHAVITYTFWSLLRVCSRATRAAIPVSPRTWYLTALLLAVSLHCMSLAPLLMLRLSPGWLRPDIVAQLDFRAIFLPAPFWLLEIAQVENFAQGVSHFLQWDETLTGLAICAWAWNQFVAVGGSGRETGVYGKLGLGVYLGGLLLLGGPVAVAAYLMFECDRMEEAKLVKSTDGDKKLR